MDDVHFLKQNGDTVDHEVLLDSTGALSKNDYTQHLATLQNVIGVRLKMSYVPHLHNHIQKHCRTLRFDQRAVELAAGRYSGEDLAHELTEKTGVAVEFDHKLGKFKTGSTALVFDGNNHRRLCRVLGIPLNGVHVGANQHFPYRAQLEGQEVVRMHVSDLVTFVVPTGMYKDEQNTCRQQLHPVTLHSMRVQLYDRDDEPLDIDQDHWCLLQVRCVSVSTKSIPIDFKPSIAAPNYVPTAGLYNNGYPDSDDNETYYAYSSLPFSDESI